MYYHIDINQCEVLSLELMQATTICKALGDPNRLQIVQLLTEGEKCGCDLLEKLQIGQPTLSHHMKILCDCRLVTARKAAKWSYYSLDCDQWTAFRDFIDAIRCTCAVKEKSEGGCCCS